MFRRFPGLKLALAEGGIGWIPYFLEKADFVYDHHRAWTGEDFGDKLPSQVFREHVQTCFIDDETGLRNRHQIGIDTITWECRLPALRLDVAAVAGGPVEVAARRSSPTTRSTRSPGRTPAAGTASIRSSTATAPSARSARCGPSAIDVDTTPREYGDADHRHDLSRHATSFLSRNDMTSAGD